MSNENGVPEQEPEFPGAPAPEFPGAPAPDVQPAPPPQQMPPPGGFAPPGYGPPAGSQQPPPGYGPPPGAQPPVGPPPGYGPPAGQPQAAQPPGDFGPPAETPPGGFPPPGAGVPPGGFGPSPGAQPPGGFPPGGPVPPDDTEPPAKGGSGIGWKIATGVGVLVAAGALAWGFMQKTNADTAAQDSAAEISRLQADIAADQQEEDEVKEALNKAKAAHAEVAQKLKTTGKELKHETSQLKSLKKQYQQAAKEAEQKNATLSDELAAQESKTALATKCAQVLATGMEVIYNAETPEEVMHDVAKEMQKATDSCEGVVSFP